MNQYANVMGFWLEMLPRMGDQWMYVRYEEMIDDLPAVARSVLGFLGLGPPDPRTPEWGTMLTDSTKFLRQAPWLIFLPGLAIVISAIGFNLLGDGLRESLDPRLKR